MVNTFLSKKLIIPAVIFIGGLLISSGILVSANFTAAQLSAASQSSQWTQKTGEGFSVPACGSSSTSLPTCESGGTATYTLNWDATAGACVQWVIIYENGVALSDSTGTWGPTGYDCVGQKTFSGRPSNTTYTYIFDPDTRGDSTNALTVNTLDCTLPPSPTNNASCGAVSAPANVFAGRSFSASVTTNNTGTKPWQTLAPIASHQLVAVTSPGVGAGALWGLGGYSLPSSPINPGSSATFSMSPTAPSTPGTYNFSWQMIEQGLEFFGPVCSQAITVYPWGTLVWAATLDGAPWTGTININGTTPNGPTPPNYPVPTGTYTPTNTGVYTYSYSSGGPVGATFQNVTPSGSQTLLAGGTITFTWNFVTPIAPSCTASPSSVVIGQSTNLTAGGGDGTYSWFIPGGTPASGSGSPISTSYSTTDTKTVTVTSAGQNRTCEINVTSTPVPGCTDPAATNYNPSATVDDGSCTYPSTYTLTVNSSGASNVIITGSPSTYGGTTNPTSYTKISIPSGTGITLTAPLTSGGNNFANWSGCDTTSGTNCTVTMIANKTVTATYTPPTSETLKVKRANMDSSFFVAQPTSAWVDNIGPDTANLATFTVSAGGHTVYASKVVGYTIVDAGFCDGLNCTVAAFSLPLTCDASRCSVFVTVNQGIEKKVVFRYDVTSVTNYTVTASVSGSGTITGPGISCPGDCSEIYPSGTWITVIATPSAGYSFTSWASGAGSICAGQGSTCSALIDGNKTVGANFSSSVPFDYSLSNSGTSNVTKTSGDAFTQNTITKTLTSGKPQTVTLSLSGEPAGVTHSFSGGGTCSPPCTSVITFTVAPITLVGTYPITVTGTSAGTPNKTTIFDLVVLASSGGSMSVSCSASAPTALIGESVTWTAVVSGGTSPFTYSWSGTNIPTNPSPNTNPFSISYSTIGQKIAIVTVTDANSVVARCDGGAGGGSGGNAGTIYINFDPSFREF